MGGGTPTALSAPQLDRVLTCARECFPGAMEWTVEAGRPDTITRDKLRVILDHGTGRISINPQTMSDRTLQIIGRNHTGEDVVRAYELAREMGFGHINMDVIAGLPGESLNDFAHTMESKYTPSVNFRGVLNKFYDDLVIYGSDKIRHPHISRVQEFDFQRMVPYTPKYLAGIPAERYTVGLNDGWERAKEQIRAKTKRILNRKFFMKATIDAINYSFYNVKFRYVLAPIYLATFKCGKKTYPVAINGQTGKAYCKFPTFLGKLVVIPLIVILLSLLVFFIAVIAPELR